MNAPVEACEEALVELLRNRSFAVLTGAGVSTESGIPDYRGPETRRRARDPLKYRAFMDREDARRRYWARALVGWERFAGRAPNPGHHALAALERAGRIDGLITQNVDRLHTAAGSRDVVELHGALAEVVCVACGEIASRDGVQTVLRELNPQWVGRSAEMAPDGDAELEGDFDAFRVPACASCGGFLKPHVVFFGEGVPRERVERAYAKVDAAEALLVVGSSLAVFSGYRFVRRAAAAAKPIALLNLGESRADDVATVHVAAPSGRVLPCLARALGVPVGEVQQQPGRGV